jgi:hypothetical protein
MCGANNVPILESQQRRNMEGSGLDSMLGAHTENATVAWLEAALDHAYSHGQHVALAYLEAVMEDVVFEEEMAARTATFVGWGLPLLDSGERRAQRGLDHPPEPRPVRSGRVEDDTLE